MIFYRFSNVLIEFKAGFRAKSLPVIQETIILTGPERNLRLDQFVERQRSAVGAVVVELQDITL